jgi:hypothetical protein
MLPMYSKHCLSRQAVHNWVQFLEGRTSIEDEHRVGRPVEITTLATLQRVEDIIQVDRRVTIDAVATAIGCSHPLLPYFCPQNPHNATLLYRGTRIQGRRHLVTGAPSLVMCILIIARHNKTR